ncbi:MAG: D-alanyl-D-alanine carboxypeptidase family protein [Oscillospiraceae bacterium]
MILKRTIAAICALFIMPIHMVASADNGKEDFTAEDINAASVYVCETESGTVLYEKNSAEQLPMGHMAKLMTVLITAEELEKGSVSLDEIVTVSANANSKQGTQIWLDAGEKISVEELLKSITIGNANDACTALAEHLSGTENGHIKRLNKRAKRLGMNDTYFADCCGTDKDTVSTAHDIAILSSKIAKYDNLTGYLTTWIDNVRCEAIELVSTNRMIRTYKGVKGTKSCNIAEVGESLSVTVKRRNFSICCVVFGCKDADSKFYYASKLLDGCFEKYRIFTPEIDKKYLKKIDIVNGRKLKLSVKPENFTSPVLKAEQLYDISQTFEIAENVNAPVQKGDELGKIVYTSGGEEVLVVRILAAETVEKMDFAFAFRMCLDNLLNLRA